GFSRVDSGVPLKVFVVYVFEESGEYAEIRFNQAVTIPDGWGGLYRKPAYVNLIAGRCHVVDGAVHFYTQLGGHCWWPADSVQVEANRILYGTAPQVAYLRQPLGLDPAIRAGEAYTDTCYERDLLMPDAGY
ncbi:MAG: hypothetical protein JXR94_22130, partial [Candidatus Hydrogenedentes bacterium]|nr:hypothetical protein [Candidatus Hydrogenedentota bacterium]